MTGLRARLQLLAAVAAGLLLLLAPRVFARGILNDIWSVAFAVVLASAWNLLGGLAGQVSIGYSAFLGIGAYTTALLALRGMEPYATVPLAALLAAAFSYVVGLPTFRLRGPYFTIATIGVGEAVRVLAGGVSFTGGSSGIRMPPGSFDFGLNYASMVVLAVAVVALAARVSGGSEAAVGLVMSARMVPGFFLAPVGGVLIDRWDRRTVLICCELSRGLALAGPGTGGGAPGAEYGSYLTRLRERIQEALRYPPAARRRGLQGTVALEIVIRPDGTFGLVGLADSSSHALLDAAALETVRRLAPEPFPPGVPPRHLRVRLPVVFTLE